MEPLVKPEKINCNKSLKLDSRSKTHVVKVATD
jgi:hypothetical protein